MAHRVVGEASADSAVVVEQPLEFRMTKDGKTHFEKMCSRTNMEPEDLVAVQQNMLAADLLEEYSMQAVANMIGTDLEAAEADNIQAVSRLIAEDLIAAEADKDNTRAVARLIAEDLNGADAENIQAIADLITQDVVAQDAEGMRIVADLEAAEADSIHAVADLIAVDVAEAEDFSNRRGIL